MNVLYIGGSGEISHACVEASIKAGHAVTVFNRGKTPARWEGTVEQVTGDMTTAQTYSALADQHFDVVCQFIAFDPDGIQRDIDTFRGRCDQYIFISTASAYQKPVPADPITEAVPLDNPFWAYSRAKAACERVLSEADTFPVTVVRPSHTYRTRLPGTCLDTDHMTWRILHDKPVIVMDDGESPWTLTYASDFAAAFLGLFGATAAIGEAFHITSEAPHTWDEIVLAVGRALNRTPNLVHVPTRSLIEYDEAWRGPLLGDKSNPAVFNNNKVRTVVGDWHCRVDLEEGLALAAPFALARQHRGYQPDPAREALVDRICRDFTP